MTPAQVSASVQLLPSRSMRAGILAYVGALAAIEVSTGVVVAEAWREQHQQVVIPSGDIAALGEMFQRLRVIEGVVAAGAVITTVLWSFIAVRNASTACRNGRSGATAVVAWGLVPIVVLALCTMRDGGGTRPMVVLAVQAAVMFVPFATIGVAARRVGGRMAPFVRWYIALALTFVVHETFTGSFNLADLKPKDDLGRAAALMIASGIALGLMVLMAGDAARSLDDATERKMQSHRDWRNEALGRFRRAVGPDHRQPVRPQPDRPAFSPMSMVAAIPTMAPRSGVLVAERTTPPPPVEVVAQPTAPVSAAPVAPAPVAPVVEQPAVPATSMFAPLQVRTFPSEPVAPPAPSAEPLVASVSDAGPVGQPVEQPAAVEQPVEQPTVVEQPVEQAPATPSMFAPLAPRTTPRSL